MTKAELEPLPLAKRLADFSVCVQKDKYVLLTGGDPGPSGFAFLFDCELGHWIEQPSLVQPRSRHSSTATETATYVYGGRDGEGEFLNTFERLAFAEETDWEGNKEAREWTSFTVAGLSPRREPLMVHINKSAMLILGGFYTSNLSDGAIIDP